MDKNSRISKTALVIDTSDLQGAIDLYSIPVPEPSSHISFLAIGIGGSALTLKRKLKQSKSTEKDTTKVD